MLNQTHHQLLTPFAYHDTMDELIITRRDEAPQFVKLDKSMLIIGRDTMNDIALESPAVSRKHARLERVNGVWHVTDLGSTNGSWIVNERLPSNTLNLWKAGVPLQIGGFTLHWQSKQDQTTNQTLVLMPGDVDLPDSILDTEDDPNLNVILSEQTVTISHGETAEFKLGVLSTSKIMKQLELDIAGIPENWISSSHSRLRISPKQHRSVLLSIAPNKHLGASAGEYPFEVLLRDTLEPRFLTRVSGLLTITEKFDFSITSRLEQVGNQAHCFISISNTGNISDEYKIVTAPPEAVEVQSDIWDVALMPGSSTDMRFIIKATNPPLFGKAEEHEISFNVSSAQGAVKTAADTFVVSSRLFGWFRR